MQEIKTYLKQTQPIVYKTLQNAFKNNKTTHAYIINGAKGSMVLPVAEFMAQSFVCFDKNEDGFACETCIDCIKIKEKNFIDYMFFNGEDLKKDQVLNIQKEFNKSAVEKQNIKIYVIHLIEKAPVASLNKLLKFIEEPSSNIIAIFTTNSLSSILPTITSRCQIVTLKQFSQNELVQKMLEENIEVEDANLLSVISNDITYNVNLAKSEEYQVVKEMTKKSLDFLCNQDDYYIYYMQSQGLPCLEKIDKLEVYLDMLQACMLETIFAKTKQKETRFFVKEISALANTEQEFDKKIIAIMQAKQELISNANKQLVFDKLLIRLIGGE